MRIKSFEVIGFKSDSRCAKIELASTQSSVVFGPNGSGKTTLLQIMSAFLSKNEPILMANKVKEINCIFSDENNKRDRQVTVSRQKEGGYEWDTSDIREFDSLKSLSIGVERGIAQQNIAINPEIIFDFLYRYSRSARKIFGENVRSRGAHFTRDSALRDEMRDLSLELARFLRMRGRRSASTASMSFDESHLNLNSIRMENIEEILSDQYREASYKTTKNIQSALFDTIAELIGNPKFGKSIEKLDQTFIDDLKKYRERIKAALSGAEENAFMKIVILALDKYCSDQFEFDLEEKPIFIILFQNMIRELTLEDENLYGVNIIVSAFNKQLEFGKKLIVDKSRVAHIEVDGERHGVAELSSGERHVLTFLTLMATAGRDRDFIFIDEPEISLNLKWQREIIGILESILPSSQIIAASHSPAIRQNPDSLCGLAVERI